ncbi:condensation domain-containing protein, partial [Zooshikella harenae]
MISHSSDKAVPKLVRPLDNTEALFAIMHSELNGNTQVLTHILIDKEIDFQKLIHAVNVLFNKYQILRTCIIEKNDQLWFAEHDDFNRVLISHSKAGNLSSAEDELQEELKKPINSSQNLWRMKLINILSLKQAMLIFVRNHAISDGYSTGLFFSLLLKALSNNDAIKSLNSTTEKIP